MSLTTFPRAAYTKYSYCQVRVLASSEIDAFLCREEATRWYRTVYYYFFLSIKYADVPTKLSIPLGALKLSMPRV